MGLAAAAIARTLKRNKVIVAAEGPTAPPLYPAGYKESARASSCSWVSLKETKPETDTSADASTAALFARAPPEKLRNKIRELRLKKDWDVNMLESSSWFALG